MEATSQANKRYNEDVQEAEAKYNGLVRKIEELRQKDDPGSANAAEMLKIQVDSFKRELDVKKEILNREKEEQIAEAENEKELSIRRIQSSFRWSAAVVPILVPSLLGLLVFAWRRMREREGMSKARIRK